MKYKDSNSQWQTIKVKNYGIEQTPIGSMIYYPSQNILAGVFSIRWFRKIDSRLPSII